MTEVDKSVKLVFNEFQRSIAEVPLEVYYQQILADQYTINGYQFNIKTPGTKALLDTDLWIGYEINFVETANDSFKGAFHGNARDAAAAMFPIHNNRFALRSGFVVQRATQNLSVMINNTTLNVRPCQWIDELNRLYISNDQAEHEFSTSGGRFEEGNHGHNTKNKLYAPHTSAALSTSATSYASQVPNTFVFQPGYNAALLAAAAGAAALGTNTKLSVNIVENWYLPPTPADTNATLYNVLYKNVLDLYDWYNPGFDHRVQKFAKQARVSNGGGASNAAVGIALGATGATNTYKITVYERLAIPLFKMYSNDEIFGVIPNITQMQIQGNFLANFIENIGRQNVNANIFTYNFTNCNCTLYLRWYTPPMSMQIPREISLPYKKITTWSKVVEFNAAGMAGAAALVHSVTYTTRPQEYNVSIEGIPDLLLIYMKYSSNSYTCDTPDDYNMEITNFNLNIDNASGKMNQVQSIDLYNKWKKLLKHSDNKIMGYDEWRKYCCVACLQPEDYGVRYGPGYSNPCVLGFSFDAVNWWRNPTMAPGVATPENLGGNAGAGVNTEVVVTCIYYKNRLIIRADGTATQEMLKIAADFDMMRPDVGTGGMGAAGYGIMNA